MLPLSKLTYEAKCGFSSHGVSENEIMACVYLDLDQNGKFGEGWLALTVDSSRLLYMASPEIISAEMRPEAVHSNKNRRKDKIPAKISEKTAEYEFFREYDLSKLGDFYLDNFVSSSRLMAHSYTTDADGEKTEPVTVAIAYSTIAHKRQLFGFIDILNRTVNGETVSDDDPLFDQFKEKCPKCGKVYVDQNKKICENCLKDRNMFIRLLSYFKPFAWRIALYYVIVISITGLSMLSPYLTGKFLFDKVIAEPAYNESGQIIQGQYHSEQWVIIVFAMIIGCALMYHICTILRNRVNTHLSAYINLNIKIDIFNKLQRLSLSFFNKNQTGSLITRVTSDANTVQSFYVNGILNMVTSILQFVGVTVFLFTINWQLTLIVFIPIPFIVWMFKVKLPKMHRMFTKQYRRAAKWSGVLNDSLSGVRVVKAFAKETEEANRYTRYGNDVYEANLQTNLISLTIFPVISLMIGLASKVVWGVGGWQVMGQFMTYGAFCSYIAYVSMIFSPLEEFTQFANTITSTMNSAKRIFDVIDAVPEIQDSKDAVEIDRLRGDIEFRRVNFNYVPNKPILKDVSFTAASGDHVGLVGHTGAGKTTIANLLSRLYDVTSGEILIDGYNVKQLSSSTLRKNIAIVSQEIFLFSGTVADNIRYARPKASFEEVIEAAKIANAHEFIMNLPDGYQTNVGTGRRSLSGGERQRISIARAILLDPAILILDEATAAMDTETERLIQEALERLVEGRTTLTIAHRLSTLKDCNLLMSIDGGEIVERGSHRELLENNGVYKKLYDMQNDANRHIFFDE